MKIYSFIFQKEESIFSVRKMRSILRISFLILLFMAAGEVGAQSLITNPPCNTPLVGPGRVVDSQSSALLALLGLNVDLLDGNNMNSVANLVDGDLSNSITIASLANVDVITPIVSIRDVQHSYAGGLRAGFMIKMNDGILGGLLANGLTIDLLNNILLVLQNNFSIRTYLNNEHQETSSIVSVTPWNASVTELQKISFVTTMPFDEIELVQTGVVSSLLSSLKIYYAFVEDPDDCNPDCMIRVITGSDEYPNPDIADNNWLAEAEELIDADLTNTATIATSQWVSVNVGAGKEIPVGSFVGFVINPIGLSLLGEIILETYYSVGNNDGNVLDSNSQGTLVGLSLTDGMQTIGLVTTQPCNELRITNWQMSAGGVGVLYAFVYFNEDGDDVYDCADKCMEGDDNLDRNGNGIPDACDICSVYGGADIYLCADETTYDFSALDSSYEFDNAPVKFNWRVLPSGNPANIDAATGVVSGMNQIGTYTVQVYSGNNPDDPECSDTINIIRRDVLQTSECNVPIVGSHVSLYNPPGTQACLLCLDLDGNGTARNVIDTTLENYTGGDPDLLNLNVADGSVIVGVKDNSRTYPADVRTGFAIGAASGLLDLDVLSGLELRTYLDDTLQESVWVGGTDENGLISVEAVDGADGQQRVELITTKPFDAVVLVKRGSVGVSLLSSSIRVYYAFQEPAGGCEKVADTDCDEPIVGGNVSTFSPAGGSAPCVLCSGGSSADASIVTDNNLNNYIQDPNSASVAADVPIIGVQNPDAVYPTDTRVGFIIGTDALQNVNLLSRFDIWTYQDGTLVEKASSIDGSLQADRLESSDNRARISFAATQPFDGVALVSKNTLSSNLLNTLRIYYAFQQPPTSTCGETVGDCMQYLTAGNDYQASIAYNHSGVTSTLCVGCEVSDIGSLIDNDVNTPARINLPVGLDVESLLASLVGAGEQVSIASISVHTPQVISGSHQVGFIFSPPNGVLGILDANLLANIAITTYLGGVKRETFSGSGNLSLLNLAVLGKDDADKRATLSFTTQDGPLYSFDEIQFSVTGLLPTSLLNTDNDYDIFNAFIRPDSDGDGVPDCMDKCCLGEDHVVGDDGLPAECYVTVDFEAMCRMCPATVTITGPGLSTSEAQRYSLYRDGVQVGVYTGETFVAGEFDRTASPARLVFEPDTSGIKVQYYLATVDNRIPVKDVFFRIHPPAVTWKGASTSSPTAWKDSTNWISDDGSESDYPVWCTDVTIPDSISVFPTVQHGDECKDLYLRKNFSIGQITYLEYRHAYVEYYPPRNMWVMTTAPLKYMYSADYGADRSWSSAITPKVFMRYFDVEYSSTSKPNPDGVVGTSTGNFSRAFVKLDERLPAGQGFAIWVNGSPDYDDEDFPTTESYQFPRRDADGNDVLYSMHLSSGAWSGEPFYMPERGDDITAEKESWTEESESTGNNRYRFIYEGLLDTNHVFTMDVDKGVTEIIGNPFVSHIDFNQFYEDNSGLIYNYYRIWDGEQFYSYMYGEGNPVWSGLDGLSSVENDSIVSRYIEPLQAFFIETRPDAAITELRFEPHILYPEMSNSLRSASAVKQSSVLRLNVKSDTDEGHTVIAVLPSATNKYNPEEDIYRLFSPHADVPEIYTVSEGVALDINAVSLNEDTHTIPIGIKTSRVGIMEMSVSGADAFSAYYEVYLKDVKEDKLYNMRETEKVLFTKTESGNLEGRFYIILTDEAGTGTEFQNNQESGIAVFCQNHILNISSPDMTIDRWKLYDLSGKLYYEDSVNGNYYKKYLPNIATGVYILKIEAGNNTINCKLFF